MNEKVIYTVTILTLWITCCFTAPAIDGKYDPNNVNSGRYIPTDEGKYVHKAYPYVHVHDSRELGIYHHIHIPYDGGYGPYNGSNIPYIHDENGAYSDDRYTVSTLDQGPYSYDIPSIPLVYGFPDHTPTRKKRHIASAKIAKQSTAKAIILPNSRLITAITDADIDANEQITNNEEIRNIVLDSQTPIPRPTTTERPRRRYVDEGNWRIIRQEEDKRRHKYDYLYLTENGIYAEEQGKLSNDKNQATGTSSKGYYEYTGDDGKLYRVHYTVGEEGFVPSGDHIPTVPPAIQRALDYIAAQEQTAAAHRF